MRHRKTKYHKRTYWYEVVIVSMFVLTFGAGVFVGSIL